MSQLVTGVVQTPYYDWAGRKYMEVRQPDGHVFRFKIPFRYGRVMARVSGIRPIQDLKLGETVQVFIERKFWDGEVHWVLVSLTPLESLESQNDHEQRKDPDP